MSNPDWLDRVTQAHRKANLPPFKSGDEVRVWCRIMERDRVRLVPFEGVVIRRRGAGLSQTCTIRRVTHGEGVERGFPLHAPVVERLEVLRRTNVRRARLYFLRTRIGKTRFADAETAQTATSSGEGRLPAKMIEGQAGGTDVQRPQERRTNVQGVESRGSEAQPSKEPETSAQPSQQAPPSSPRP